MAQQCPLLFRQVDATITRINTLFVIAGVIAYLMSGIVAIIVLVFFDFLLRLFGRKEISPTQNASLWIQRTFSLPSYMVDAGAKRLAGFFGAGFMAAIVVFHGLGIEWGVHGVAALYLACAVLELFFGFCVGCKLYYIVKKLYPRGFE